MIFNLAYSSPFPHPASGFIRQGETFSNQSFFAFFLNKSVSDYIF